MTIDMDATYQAKQWPGVAVRIYGFPNTDCGDVIVVMVGDDKKHQVSIDDLTILDELDYCSVCGQVGCGHD